MKNKQYFYCERQTNLCKQCDKECEYCEYLRLQSESKERIKTHIKNLIKDEKQINIILLYKHKD